jgi:hypothetical protein
MGSHSKTIAAGGAFLAIQYFLTMLDPLIAYYLPNFNTNVWLFPTFKDSLLGVLMTLAVYFAPPNTSPTTQGDKPS